MKGHGAVLADHLAGYRLTTEQLEQLHTVLFGIMKDFKEVCDKNGLTYMLCGGTLLGAVRHQGFIPWDDDVDVMMPRNDYEKLAEAFADNDKYFVEVPLESDCVHKPIKIMLKDTTYVEVGTDNPDFPGRKNMFIDVFPIDNMPKGKARFRAFRFKIAFHATNFICEKKYKSPIILKAMKENKVIKKYYKKRFFIAALVRILGSYKHHMKVVQKLANYKKETGYLGIPLGIAYNREKFKAEVLSETAELPFNGVNFTVPLHYKEYLTNLYGSDYMTPPPPNEKGSHLIAQFNSKEDMRK